MTAARLALLADFPEENWPSMDLVAEQLLLGLERSHTDHLNVQRVCAKYVHCSTRFLGSRGATKNVDRLLNRFVVYPRFARRISGDFDLYHLCDHSYSQVIHSLPADRTGVFCHDLDTFRCILDPAAEPRPRWFRAMANRILRGMQKARLVFHTTDEVRRQIIHHGLIDPTKLIQAPYGIAAEFVADGDDQKLLDGPFLLHVGSCIPRKRIDVLLDVFAAVRQKFPDMKLVQIGGEWTAPQREQIDRLGIESGLIALGRQPREIVAAHYRRAAAVLMPSESEGFGLPVAEAMACGAIVVASDIPVLREVGSAAAMYAPLADVPAWAALLEKILQSPEQSPKRAMRLARAGEFSWDRHASIIAAAYQSIR